MKRIFVCLTIMIVLILCFVACSSNISNNTSKTSVSDSSPISQDISDNTSKTSVSDSSPISQDTSDNTGETSAPDSTSIIQVTEAHKKPIDNTGGYCVMEYEFGTLNDMETFIYTASTDRNDYLSPNTHAPLELAVTFHSTLLEIYLPIKKIFNIEKDESDFPWAKAYFYFLDGGYIRALFGVTLDEVYVSLENTNETSVYSHIQRYGGYPDPTYTKTYNGVEIGYYENFPGHDKPYYRCFFLIDGYFFSVGIQPKDVSDIPKALEDVATSEDYHLGARLFSKNDAVVEAAIEEILANLKEILEDKTSYPHNQKGHLD